MSARPLNIGPVTFPNQLVLAPLSGITNLPFRLIAKSFGAGMVVSELVSSNGLVHASQRTRRYLNTHPDEWPVVMQIFGDDPDCMAISKPRVRMRSARSTVALLRLTR